MNLESYLRSLNISDVDIQRLRDEKIDSNVISVMSDEELAWFIKSAGDRVLVRNFIKTSDASGPQVRKEHLIKNIRDRLASIRSKRLGKSEKKQNKSDGPNTKSTRQLYLGWKHREGERLIQVIEKKGGGTKLLSMPKDYKKSEIIELGKKLYFPNGKSSKGIATKFIFELMDSTNKILSSDKTVLEILEENSPKIPRIYLKTERIQGRVNRNEVQQVTYENTAPVSTEDFAGEVIDDENVVTVLYADRSMSKYSGAAAVSFKNKKQIFEQISRFAESPVEDYTNFDPEDYDYPIAKMEVDGEVTLDIEAQFLHQADELNSSITLPIAQPSPGDDSKLSETLLPIVARKDITFLDRILGAGSQGTVREGIWLGTQVAIKSFKTGKLTEAELREVKLLARIRHPNIIQIMGICLEKRQTHLIFELVNGDNLGDMLFDEEKKERYSLDDEKKKKLLCQVCQAISYLHGQTNPIIHQDIKPDNILVSKNFIVKLCDLGLAKLKNMTTHLRTVVGSIKGTVAYMAPEILLSRETATIHSDIWSLGCTILETYTEEDVWPNLAEDFTTALKKKMENFETPDISGLPSYLQLIIQNCFNYNFRERPGIEEVLDCFNTKSIEENM